METIVEVVGVLLSSIVLWAGIKKLNFKGYMATTITILENIVLLITVFLLGSWWWILFVMVNIAAFLIQSTRLAMQKQSLLTYAATQTDATYEAMEALHSELTKKHEAAKWLGPVKVAVLINELSRRNRSIEEIKDMAIPIAMLVAVHRPEWPAFIAQFDRIMRIGN